MCGLLALVVGHLDERRDLRVDDSAEVPLYAHTKRLHDRLSVFITRRRRIFVDMCLMIGEQAAQLALERIEARVPRLARVAVAAKVGVYVLRRGVCLQRAAANLLMRGRLLVGVTA